MKDDQRRCIDKCWDDLSRDLDIDTLLPVFISAGISSSEEHQEFDSSKYTTTRNRNVAFLIKLKTKSPRAFDVLLDSMRDSSGQQHLAECLEHELQEIELLFSVIPKEEWAELQDDGMRVDGIERKARKKMNAIDKTLIRYILPTLVNTDIGLSAKDILQSTSSESLLSEEERVVLIGKTGAGKSSTGNTIIGKEKPFRSHAGTMSCTQNVQAGCVTLWNTLYRILDTPGIFDPGRKEDELKWKLTRILDEFADGVTIFAFIMDTIRFTEQEEAITGKIEKLFGEKVMDYSVLILSNADRSFSDTTLEDELRSDNKYFQDLLRKVGGRVIGINNNYSCEYERVRQVDALLQVFKKVAEGKEEKVYNCEILRKAHKEKMLKESMLKEDEEIRNDEGFKKYNEASETVKQITNRLAKKEIKQQEEPFHVGSVLRQKITISVRDEMNQTNKPGLEIIDSLPTEEGKCALYELVKEETEYVAYLRNCEMEYRHTYQQVEKKTNQVLEDHMNDAQMPSNEVLARKVKQSLPENIRGFFEDREVLSLVSRNRKYFVKSKVQHISTLQNVIRNEIFEITVNQSDILLSEENVAHFVQTSSGVSRHASYRFLLEIDGEGFTTEWVAKFSEEEVAFMNLDRSVMGVLAQNHPSIEGDITEIVKRRLMGNTLRYLTDTDIDASVKRVKEICPHQYIHRTNLNFVTSMSLLRNKAKDIAVQFLSHLTPNETSEQISKSFPVTKDLLQALKDGLNFDCFKNGCSRIDDGLEQLMMRELKDAAAQRIKASHKVTEHRRQFSDLRRKVKTKALESLRAVEARDLREKAKTLIQELNADFRRENKDIEYHYASLMIKDALEEVISMYKNTARCIRMKEFLVKIVSECVCTIITANSEIDRDAISIAVFEKVKCSDFCSSISYENINSEISKQIVPKQIARARISVFNGELSSVIEEFIASDYQTVDKEAEKGLDSLRQWFSRMFKYITEHCDLLGENGRKKVLRGIRQHLTCEANRYFLDDELLRTYRKSLYHEYSYLDKLVGEIEDFWKSKCLIKKTDRFNLSV